MALDAADEKRITEIVNGVIGGEEFTTRIGETVSKTTNELINKTLKAQKKDTEKLFADWRQEQADREAKAAEEREAAAGSGGGGDGKGNGQLPPEVAKRLEASAKSITELQKQLADQKKAVESEKAAREKVEGEREQMALTDAIRTAALSKDAGADPNRVDVLLDHVLHRGMVVKNESGNGYRMMVGTDTAGDPVYAPIDEGMKKFLSSDRGLMFKPAVKGSGVDVNANAGGGGGGAGGKKIFAADILRAGQPGGMTGAQIREALANGTLTADEA